MSSTGGALAQSGGNEASQGGSDDNIAGCAGGARSRDAGVLTHSLAFIFIAWFEEHFTCLKSK